MLRVRHASVARRGWPGFRALAIVLPGADHGMRLALEERCASEIASQALGVTGRSIELVTLDDAQGAGSRYRGHALITEYRVKAITGEVARPCGATPPR